MSRLAKVSCPNPQPLRPVFRIPPKKLNASEKFTAAAAMVSLKFPAGSKPSPGAFKSFRRLLPTRSGAAAAVHAGSRRFTDRWRAHAALQGFGTMSPDMSSVPALRYTLTGHCSAFTQETAQ
ncbi:hypothetical protein EYF80_009574 [Liparis tanakae]|uniref:Uncharacterized protein n=1 Tax=Liparis tanakae TaxID=230148 RepID=A0A4Z2IQL0_9TELE|nr:hypothetical protein EYF80_009574 [Liparis tanakae]